MQEREFLALDCETTGLESSKDKIIELGATRFRLGEDLQTFDEIFDPGVRLPDLVVRLTGISNEDVVGKQKFEVQQEPIRQLATDATLLGHNLQFDTGFLASHGVDLSVNSRFDTFDIASLVLPRVSSLSLVALGGLYGVLHESAHRALSDAEATRDLFRCLVGEARRQPAEIWQQILGLQVTQKSWLQDFAEIVLDGGLILPPHLACERHSGAASELINSTESNPELAAELSKLFETGKPALLETTISADTIAATLASTNCLIVTASQQAAAALATKHGLPLMLAPRFLQDPTRVGEFVKKQLSPVEAAFAAKLLLHPAENFFQLNLSRAEKLLWDFICQKESQQVPAQLCVTHHGSLPELELTADMRVIILDSAALPGTLSQRDAFALDLPALETLLPDLGDRLTIWWGLLGQLWHQAAPLYGQINLNDTTGLLAYANMLAAGENLLESIGDRLPPALTAALTNYLNNDPSYSRSLRTDSGGHLTIGLESQPDPAAIADLATRLGSVVFSDGALSTAPGNFNYILQQLGLPPETPAASLAGSLTHPPELAVATDLPAPAEKSFQQAAEKKLLELVNSLPGITTVVFSGRYAMGQFFERTHSGATRPVFGDRLTGSIGKNWHGLASQTDATYLATSQPFPPRTANLIVVKLPFRVRDGADWTTETLPASVLAWKKLYNTLQSVPDRPASQRVILLDNRIIEKKYGRAFSDAVSQVPHKL